MNVKFVTSGFTITILIDGVSHVVDPAHPHYSAIAQACQLGAFLAVPELLKVKPQEVIKVGDVEVVSGDGIGDETITAVFKGSPIPLAAPVKELLVRSDMVAFREAFESFLYRVAANPVKVGQTSLWNFLKHGNFPLLTNGNFLAYKSVKRVGENSYVDWHTGTTPYAIDVATTLPREQCEVDVGQACSSGLHAGTYEYAANFHSGDDKYILEVEIDPADVVSVPTSEDQKLRCCKIVPRRINPGKALPDGVVYINDICGITPLKREAIKEIEPDPVLAAAFAEQQAAYQAYADLDDEEDDEDFDDDET